MSSSRRRRLLLVLPLLSFPFITLLFWALGGGQTRKLYPQDSAQVGLNPSLPHAQLEEGMAAGKLGYYQQAAHDSAQWLELQHKDPYAPGLVVGGLPPVQTSGALSSLSGSASEGYQTQQAQVYQKLRQLEAALEDVPVVAPAARTQALPQQTVADIQLGRLEQLMRSAQHEGGADPEMQQVSGMLDKILDIQHPQRVLERSMHSSQTGAGQVFSLSFAGPGAPISLLGQHGQEAPVDSVQGFYGWDTPVTADLAPNMLPAVVQETQALVTGAIVKLRLEADVLLNGTRIPRGSFVFGTVALEGERLRIKVSSIRRGQRLFPVDLSAYDLDGLEGLYIPGAITREVARQSADRAVQGFGLPSLDSSPELQAARAGVAAAKSLFSKQAKLVRATVKAGYRVLLRDARQT